MLQRAQIAKESSLDGEIEEQVKLAYSEAQTAKYTENNFIIAEYIKTSLEKIYGEGKVNVDGSKIITIQLINNDKNYEYVIKENGEIIKPTEWIDNGDETYTKGNVTLKIGDYINYKVSENLNYSGSWRVLGFENGQIKLMSSIDVDNLKLSKIDGYNNGISQMNAICSAYSDGAYASNARSIKIEDITELTGYDKTTYNGYGKEWTYTITDDGIYYEDEDGNSGTITSVSKLVKIDGTELEKGVPYKVKKTFYGGTGKVFGFSNGTTKWDMIFNANNYWIANQYVLPGNDGYIRWSLMYMWSRTGLSGDTRYPLCISKGASWGNTSTQGVRAVVYLKSFVQVDTLNGKKDGSNAELAYEIN